MEGRTCDKCGGQYSGPVYLAKCYLCRSNAAVDHLVCSWLAGIKNDPQLFSVLTAAQGATARDLDLIRMPVDEALNGSRITSTTASRLEKVEASGVLPGNLVGAFVSSGDLPAWAKATVRELALAVKGLHEAKKLRGMTRGGNHVQSDGAIVQFGANGGEIGRAKPQLCANDSQNPNLHTLLERVAQIMWTILMGVAPNDCRKKALKIVQTCLPVIFAGTGWTTLGVSINYVVAVHCDGGDSSLSVVLPAMLKGESGANLALLDYGAAFITPSGGVSALVFPGASIRHGATPLPKDSERVGIGANMSERFVKRWFEKGSTVALIPYQKYLREYPIAYVFRLALRAGVPCNGSFLRWNPLEVTKRTLEDIGSAFDGLTLEMVHVALGWFRFRQALLCSRGTSEIVKELSQNLLVRLWLRNGELVDGLLIKWSQGNLNQSNDSHHRKDGLVVKSAHNFRYVFFPF